jgi:hypothetical protein
MWGRLFRASILLLSLANTASAPRARGSSTASDVADATVQVGHVFGQGGTDGLILYALVLSSFLLFIVSVVLTVSVFRYIARAQSTNASAFAAKDATNAEQTRMFIESMDRTAGAVSGLAVAVANDLQERQATAMILARIDTRDVAIQAALERLNRVS